MWKHPESSPSAVYDGLFNKKESHVFSKELTEVTASAQLDTIWNLLADGIDYAIILQTFYGLVSSILFSLFTKIRPGLLMKHRSSTAPSSINKAMTARSQSLSS
jgi:hypothetical protein